MAQGSVFGCAGGAGFALLPRAVAQGSDFGPVGGAGFGLWPGHVAQGSHFCRRGGAGLRFWAGNVAQGSDFGREGGAGVELLPRAWRRVRTFPAGAAQGSEMSLRVRTLSAPTMFQTSC